MQFQGLQPLNARGSQDLHELLTANCDFSEDGLIAILSGREQVLIVFGNSNQEA